MHQKVPHTNVPNIQFAHAIQTCGHDRQHDLVTDSVTSTAACLVPVALLLQHTAGSTLVLCYFCTSLWQSNHSALSMRLLCCMHLLQVVYSLQEVLTLLAVQQQILTVVFCSCIYTNSSLSSASHHLAPDNIPQTRTREGLGLKVQHNKAQHSTLWPVTQPLTLVA